MKKKNLNSNNNQHWADLLLFFQFSKYLSPYRSKECLLFFLLILTSIGGLVSPYVLKIIIDTALPSNNYILLLQILCFLVGINLFRIIISFASDYLFAWIANNITRDIRADIFSHLLKLPLSFYDKNKIGDLTHRINSEVNTIQGFLTGTIVRLIESLLTIIGLTIMLCVLNYKLFFLSMLVMPFIFANTRFFQFKIQDIIRKSRVKDADILSFLIERLENIKLIKNYVQYQTEQNKLSHKIEEQIHLDLKTVRLTSTTRSITMFFTTLIPILIFGIGGKDVMLGSMTIGTLVAFIQYMNRIFDPFRNLMGLYFDSLKTTVSMARIMELLKYPEEINQTLPVSANIKSDDIIFKNVSFGYDETLVLKGLSYKFERGKKYALVGSSGCGKSTLIDLLCRFYEIQEGAIFIGENNIRDINVNELRQKITLIMQDNQLFHDTIAENIRYGKSKCNNEKINDTIHKVGLNQLSQGLETIIGDRGVQLSGGQKQRIAIARAILKDADIIILDEATSALDLESERNLLNHLYQLYSGKTMIVISHRLSAIRDMDEIICIDNGVIIESGTHDDLIIKKGYYWQLLKNN